MLYQSAILSLSEIAPRQDIPTRFDFDLGGVNLLANTQYIFFASIVDDPSSSHDLFPTEEEQERERQRLFRIIEELVKWENTRNEAVLGSIPARRWFGNDWAMKSARLGQSSPFCATTSSISTIRAGGNAPGKDDVARNPACSKPYRGTRRRMAWAAAQDHLRNELVSTCF